MNKYVVTCDEETASWIGNDVDSIKPLVRCEMCEYCDGESNPTIEGITLTPKLLFCIRGTTLVIRVLEREWLFPQWLLDVKFCPMCGRELKGERVNE